MSIFKSEFVSVCTGFCPEILIFGNKSGIIYYESSQSNIPNSFIFAIH